MCWASLNHLDSHILYLLADEEVWWAGYPDVVGRQASVGLVWLVRWHLGGQMSRPFCTHPHPFRKSSAHESKTRFHMEHKGVVEVLGCPCDGPLCTRHCSGPCELIL